MTILEDLKAGRLVVVPREATGAAVNAAWHEGKSRRMTGLTNDFRAVLDSALAASPDHTAGLIALVEGMAAEKDDAVLGVMSPMWTPGVRAALNELPESEDLAQYVAKAKAADAMEARALAAEAERDEARARFNDIDLCKMGQAPCNALLAAEAKADALREALAPFGSGAVVFYENEPDDCVLSLGRWKYQEDGRARFYADVQFTAADVRRARALTEKNNG